MDFINELNKYGLDIETYKLVLKDIDAKLNGENDLDWTEIKDKYSITCNSDTIRKASSTIFGGKFRQDFNNYYNLDNDTDSDIDKKISELKRERIKLQTLNIERSRLDRNQARQELYYEYVGNVCSTLPLPEFKPLIVNNEENNDYVISDETHYLAVISDIHYGACFESTNNKYSKDIAKYRLENFLTSCINFVKEKKLSKISVANLGDTIQGILRINDLRINESSIVSATVEISRIIAMFLNELSTYCIVDYYHVPTANHSKTRNLNSKASELADEDLEYVIGNYISDLCKYNDRITVILADNGKQYIDIDIPFNTIVAGHGHTIKNINNAIRDLSMIQQREIQYLLLGHFHGDKNFSVNESACGDCEVIIAPSIVGSDPYADSIMRGSKSSAKIFGFNEIYGLTEQYKFILN